MKPRHSHFLLLLEVVLVRVILVGSMALISRQSVMTLILLAMLISVRTTLLPKARLISLLMMHLIIRLIFCFIRSTVSCFLILLIDNFPAVIVIIFNTFPLEIFRTSITGLIEVQRLGLLTIFVLHLFIFSRFVFLSTRSILFVIVFISLFYRRMFAGSFD